MFEDQLGRFNVWALNIDAFSSSRASLESRLKGSDSARSMVVQLLRALKMNLDYGVFIFLYLSRLEPLAYAIWSLQQHGTWLRGESRKKTLMKLRISPC